MSFDFDDGVAYTREWISAGWPTPTRVQREYMRALRLTERGDDWFQFYKGVATACMEYLSNGGHVPREEQVR